MNYNFASRMELAQPSFIRESLKLAADPNIISLAGGNPDADYFPAAEIAAAAAAALAGDWKNALQYSITEGNLNLRRHLQKRMAAIGIESELNQLIITSGSQQGLDLSAKAFIDPGDVIVVESPTYMGAVNAFKYYQPRFADAAMDEHGMDMDSLEQVLQKNRRVKFIYTIPDFQNPTGLVLAEERRRRLVELAEQYETLIIEDNPYYFMRFEGAPIPPIKHFDTCGRVVYLGSISKVLCPALRVGWVIAARELTDKYVYLKQAADLHTNELSQRIIAQYLDSFDLDAHIAAMNAAYKQKKDLMVKLIRELFPKNIQYTCPDGGLFLWLTLPEGCDALQIFNYAYEKERVIFVPGDTFYPYGGHANTARLSFATVAPEKIEEGMRRLARVFASIVK